MRVQNEETVDLEAGEEISNHVNAGHDNEMDAQGKPKNRAPTSETSPLLITLKVRHRYMLLCFFFLFPIEREMRQP